MIPIFILSYNRAGNTRTTKLLDACGVTGYKVVVRPSQYDDYARYLRRENLLKLDAEEGLSYAREFIRKRVKRGEWCLHMDDNVLGFYVCDEKFYQAYDNFERGEGGLTEINRRWDPIIKNPPGKDFATFYRIIVQDTMREADKRGAVLCGFTAQNAAAMRPHKWMDVGYVCGKVMLMKNVGFPWRHISVSTGEDYALTAAHLLEFGRVLINGWGHPRRKHYAPGGCGTYEERLPEMIRTSAELMERYPGLLRMKTPGPRGIERFEGELRLRLHTVEQIAKWRANFGKEPQVSTHDSTPHVAEKNKGMNVVTINTYGGSLLLGAKMIKANIIATMEDTGYGSKLQALNFPAVPRYERLADWPERFAIPWSTINVIAHPPCKSFSLMSASCKNNRGTESEGFQCHRNVINYSLGHHCRSLAIESVPGAYEGGHEAYEELARQYRYRVTYITLNAVSFGIPQWRPRVWILFHHTKQFRVELKPRYTLLRDVLNPGKNPVPLFSCTKTLYEKTRTVLKGTHPRGHIFSLLRQHFGLSSDEELRAKFPDDTKGYLSGYVRFLDPDGFATTLLGDTSWAVDDRLLTIEEYCGIMGFPRDYKWNLSESPNNANNARAYLSRGVCPPIAAWILKTLDRNTSGWAGTFTHEEADFGGVIDLCPKKADALAIARGEKLPPKLTPQRVQPALPFGAVIKARETPPIPRAHRYTLIDESRAYAPGSPQAEFIITALKKEGRRGLNRHEVVAKAIADPVRFPTNQPHDRAVGFWLSKLKGQGALRFAE